MDGEAAEYLIENGSVDLRRKEWSQAQNPSLFPFPECQIIQGKPG